MDNYFDSNNLYVANGANAVRNKKMKDIYKSPRFWLIVTIAVLQSLAVFNVLGGEQVDKLTNIISLALGGVIALRTIDRSADLKSTSTTVSMPATVSTVTATQE